MRQFFALLVLGLAAALLGSCGYQVGPQKPTAFEGIQTIAVPTAENRTLEPRLAALVTSQVVGAMASDGTYTAGTVDAGDAVLELVITRIDKRQLRSAQDSVFRTQELGLTLEVEYRLRLNDAGGATLRQGTVRGDTTVFPRGNYQTAERDAFQTAARRLADELVVDLANGW